MEYKVLVKGEFIFVSLKGKITKESKELLEACLREALGNEAKTAVLLLKDVVSIDFSMTREFTLFQGELRKKYKHLFLVGLKVLIKEDLNNKGLLRTHELRSNLEDVIGSAVLT